MLATFSSKLSEMESTLKEHSHALAELQTLLQLDIGTDGSTDAAGGRGGGGGGNLIVVDRPGATQTRHRLAPFLSCSYQFSSLHAGFSGMKSFFLE